MLNAIILQKVVGLVARHVLTAAGTFMVAEGYTDEATWQTINGGAMAVIGIGWSAFEKKKFL